MMEILFLERGLTLFRQQRNNQDSWLLKISLLTYETFREKQPAYLQSMRATSLHRDQTKELVCWSRIKTNTAARTFHSRTPSLWNNLPLSERLSQRDGAPVNISYAFVGLDTADWQTNTFVWSQWTWLDKNRVKINRPFSWNICVAQQTDPEQYSKFYE